MDFILVKPAPHMVTYTIDNRRFKDALAYEKFKNAEERCKTMFGAFGEEMANFIREIKANANKFQKLPLGPLGMEIKLKPQVNKNQAALIEFELKSLFKDFLVDNNKDFVTLSNLATKSKIPLLNNITMQLYHSLINMRTYLKENVNIINILLLLICYISKTRMFLIMS